MRLTAQSLAARVCALIGATAFSAAFAQAPMPMDVPVPAPSVMTFWDIPVAETSAQPGAVVVPKSSTPAPTDVEGTVWEVLFFGSQVIRLNPGTLLDAILGTEATWTAWSLGGPALASGLAVDAGGLVFVRTSDSLKRLDPSSNLLTSWADGGGNSQVAVDSSGAVYSALNSERIERLVPTGVGDATATTWQIGDGSGSITGLVVNSTSGLVYFSASDFLGELDPATGTVRRWNLPPGVTQPQELTLNRLGDVWAVTQSNHIVRLTVATDQVTVFTIPTPFSSPRGIASDLLGIIGFTESQTNKVGFLLPIGVPSSVTPSQTTVSSTTSMLNATPSTQTPDTGMASPITTADTAGATLIPFPSAKVSLPPLIELNLPFIETTTPEPREQGSSHTPWGIDSDAAIPILTFYYSTSIDSTGNRIVRIIP